MARHLQRTTGKAVRFLVSTGPGMIPVIGAIAGGVIGALDTFLLDGLLKPSGAISFVSSSYPSLLKDWPALRVPFREIGRCSDNPTLGLHRGGGAILLLGTE